MIHQNREEGLAHFTSVSEFLLTQPLLSFVVRKAKMFKMRLHDEHTLHENGEEHSTEDTLEGMDESETDIRGKNFGVQLQLYGILTK